MATGHVRKRGKKWAYVQYATDPATGIGKYRWKSGFATKSEAQRALREAITAVEKGTFIEPSKMTYGEYVERIWLPQLDDQLESSTIESYERNMRVHVLPRIGGIKLQQLGPIRLNDLYRDLQSQEVTGNDSANRRHDSRIYPRINYLRSQDYSYAAIAEKLADEFPDQKPLSKNAVAAIVRRSKNTTKRQGRLAVRTVRYIHTIISRSLKDAVKLGLVNDNVAKNASPPRKPKTKTVRPMWTAEQTRTFLEWARADEHRLWVAWAFIATSGDRRGANLGLRWQDIDFDKGTAALTWTVTCVNHKIVVKPYGKTGDNHAIILDEGTLAILRTWRSFQSQERLIHGDSHVCSTPEPTCELMGYHVRDLVFARPDGDYLHPERFSREFKRAQRRYNRDNPDAQIPEIRDQHPRAATRMGNRCLGGWRTNEDRLNHASERITADIYTHVRAPMQPDAAERVAGLMLPSIGDLGS